MAIDKVVSASITDSSVTDAKLSFNSNQFRNIIINGDMSIAQRGTSVSSVTGTDATCDRWRFTPSSAGTWTISQSTTVPTGQGFATSFKADCTSANTSLSAGSILRFSQFVEGQNIQYLKKGTSSAESLTISFWVRSAKTGTYILNIKDRDNSRIYSQSYTISSADTWEKKTITYAGDTTNPFDNDNDWSLEVHFWLAAGSTYTSGTLTSGWESNTVANLAVGQVNLADSTSNDWYITGVQVEVGSVASNFEFLPFDVNLARCQRYYWRSYADTFYFKPAKDNQRHAKMTFPVTMRATPTATYFPTNADLEAGTNSAKAAKDVGSTTVSTSNVGGDRNYNTALVSDTTDSNFRVNTKASAEFFSE